MKKNIQEISLLIDFYGKLLTDKQLNHLSNYYFNDLSLSEIANNNKISKIAIHDSIKIALRELQNFEEKLLFVTNFKKRVKLYESINNDELKEMLFLTEVYNKWKN